MIGGVDIVIPTGEPLSGLDFCVRIVRTFWPRAVFEDAESGNVTDCHVPCPELFIYRDRNAAKLWESEGASGDSRNTMIHLIAGPRDVTVVVDELTAEMVAITSAIRAGLQSDILNVRAKLEKAA